MGSRQLVRVLVLRMSVWSDLSVPESHELPALGTTIFRVTPQALPGASGGTSTLVPHLVEAVEDLVRSGELRRAQQLLNRFGPLLQRPVDAQAMTLWRYGAMIHGLLGFSGDGEEWYAQAARGVRLRHQGEHELMVAAKALLCLRRGEVERAAAVLRRETTAAPVRPVLPWFAVLRAWALLHQGRLDECAFELDPLLVLGETDDSCESGLTAAVHLLSVGVLVWRQLEDPFGLDLRRQDPSVPEPFAALLARLAALRSLADRWPVCASLCDLYEAVAFGLRQGNFAWGVRIERGLAQAELRGLGFLTLPAQAALVAIYLRARNWPMTRAWLRALHGRHSSGRDRTALPLQRFLAAAATRCEERELAAFWAEPLAQKIGNRTVDPGDTPRAARPSDLAAVVRAVIEQRRGEVITIVELVKLVGVSRRTLESKVRARTGRSLKEYIDSLRLETAVHYIERAGDSGRDLREIALQSGFSSYRSFVRCYRKQYGHLPRDANPSRAAQRRSARN